MREIVLVIGKRKFSKKDLIRMGVLKAQQALEEKIGTLESVR